MGIENGEGDDDQFTFPVYPTQRSYQKRPRGNICPECGTRILLTPKGPEYYLRWLSGDLVPLCNDCGDRLHGG